MHIFKDSGVLKCVMTPSLASEPSTWKSWFANVYNFEYTLLTTQWKDSLPSMSGSNLMKL